MTTEKPDCAFLRLPQVLEIFPISRSAWWKGCKEGRYPQPLKLGPRTTVWRKADREMRDKIFELAAIAANNGLAKLFVRTYR